MKVARKVEDGRPTALGVHIYAGGFTIGVQRAGFRVLGHLEEWPFGVETSKKNLGVRVFQGLDTWDDAVRRFAGKVDWLYGNPPCASWSVAGRKVADKERNVDRWAKDGRTDCTRRLFALIPRVNPTVFTWESVAAAKKNGAVFVDERSEEAMKLGFRVYHVLFDGYDCGLPQHRRRFFFVASKVRIPFERPSMKHTTVREALAKVKDPGDAIDTRDYAVKILKRMPKGVAGSLHHYFNKMWKGRTGDVPRNKHGQVKGRPGFLHKRVPWDGPAPTVTGGYHLYHPDENRVLSPTEQKVLCGYPLSYEFAGSISAQYAQIGKAVLPPSAEWLARCVMAGIEAGEKVSPKVVQRNYLKSAKEE